MPILNLSLISDSAYGSVWNKLRYRSVDAIQVCLIPTDLMGTYPFIGVRFPSKGCPLPMFGAFYWSLKGHFVYGV